MEWKKCGNGDGWMGWGCLSNFGVFGFIRGLMMFFFKPWGWHIVHELTYFETGICGISQDGFMCLKRNLKGEEGGCVVLWMMVK